MIIIFPRHERDENRMRRVALQILDPGATVVSVRFLNRTSFEIASYFFLQTALRIRKKNDEVFFAPRLAWGWNLEAGVLRGSQRLAKTLSALFRGISHVIVGDSHQESSITVKLLVEATGAKLVLSPEGLGVFRAKFGTYPWVVTSKSQAIASLARTFVTKASNSRADPKASNFSILWRIQRMINLLTLSGRPTLEHLRISRVDILVSDWPDDLEFGIKREKHLPESYPFSPALFAGTTKIPEPVGAIFIHQPVPLSKETWLRALRKVPNPKDRLILVKTHHNFRGLEVFVEAIRERFSSSVVQIVSEGIAEDLVRSSQPQYVVGLTSTVLFNIAVTKPSFTVLSLADALLRHANPDENQMISAETGHQLAALKALGESRIRFLP